MKLIIEDFGEKGSHTAHQEIEVTPELAAVMIARDVGYVHEVFKRNRNEYSFSSDELWEPDREDGGFTCVARVECLESEAHKILAILKSGGLADKRLTDF